MVEVLFDRLLQPDGDEQADNDGRDVNEELFPENGRRPSAGLGQRRTKRYGVISDRNQ